MDKDVKKAKRFVAVLVLACLCVALLCLGISAYIVRTETVDSFPAQILKGVGILFFVLGVGYLAAVRISSGSRKKGSDGGVSAAGNGSKTLDETNMRRALEKYIPDGERNPIIINGITWMRNRTSVSGTYTRLPRNCRWPILGSASPWMTFRAAISSRAGWVLRSAISR